MKQFKAEYWIRPIRKYMYLASYETNPFADSFAVTTVSNQESEHYYKVISLHCYLLDVTRYRKQDSHCS